MLLGGEEGEKHLKGSQTPIHFPGSPRECSVRVQREAARVPCRRDKTPGVPSYSHPHSLPDLIPYADLLGESAPPSHTHTHSSGALSFSFVQFSCNNLSPHSLLIIQSLGGTWGAKRRTIEAGQTAATDGRVDWRGLLCQQRNQSDWETKYLDTCI